MNILNDRAHFYTHTHAHTLIQKYFTHRNRLVDIEIKPLK